ncbi:MAG: HAD-IC family P-type ATPase, partial [Patescibacteria group bacterium]
MSISLDVFNSYKSDQAARLLKEKVRINSLVIRGRKTQLIPRELIVPGDVVFLSPGDLVPADGTISHAKDFFLNESALTGESYPREILDDGEAMMGSSVVTGEAYLKVQKTGKSTKYGTITKSLASATASTDFDRGIRDFSKMTMWVIITLVIVVFIINTTSGRSLLESFLFAAALAVGLTPELLPVIITVNLSKGSLRMAKQGVIVKKLSSIQNLGGMDILCTDKTGTLTEDRIELVKYVDATGTESDAVLFFAYLSSYHQTVRKNPLNNAILKDRNLDISKYSKADEVPFDYSRRRDTV